ncbi:MAG: hypothetical protein L0Y74_03425 [candidate division Zixibacteria bacterium]|nr:hypothetical protein [candidate division Zixibacteria bacterium]
MSISNNLGNGDKIIPSLRISNDRTIAKDVLDSAGTLRQLIGEIEYHDLLKEGAFVYGSTEVEENTAVNNVTVVNNYLMIVQGFINELWLVKDNSVDTERGFAWFIDKNSSLPQVHASSNFRKIAFSRADGKTSTTNFTREEIRSVRHLGRTIFSLDSEGIPLEKWDVLKPHPSKPKSIADWNRFERVRIALQQTRSESDLPLKILGYCICFETLLSTDAFEIAHKIAERRACLLGDTTEKRLRIYNTIKQAYDVRSRTVHGAVTKKQPQDLISISEACDDLLRKLLTKIIEDFDFGSRFRLENKEFEKWLLELTLS